MAEKNTKLECEVEKMCELKNKLISWVEEEFSKGVECVQTDEAGEAVDMIKDLADAEKNCWKAKYYKSIVEAMEEAEEEEEAESRLMKLMSMMDGEGRMGYDNWRYSSGRFAPSGHGHRSGYTPMHMPTTVDAHWNERLGYDGDRMDGRSRSMTSGYDSPYSRSYDEYKDARRHYTESKSSSDKEEMHRHAERHLRETIDTMKEIWGDADPEMKKKMKADLTRLLGDMT